MKKRLLSLLCALTLLAGLTLPAGAAEASGIQVLLDGKSIAFTDALPQAKDSRTFLPLRAVMEAMGAEVTGSGDTVTATRDGRTLTMTVGSNRATVTENGVSRVILMDTAPYMENWRTYAPVRFAAQAFDCVVGWDGAKQTVVLVDADKLASSAVESRSYTNLEKLSAYLDKFSQGNFAVKGKLNMDAALLGSNLFTASGSMDGLTQTSRAGQMSMKLDMDLTGLFTLLKAMNNAAPGLTAEQLKPGVKADVRMDLAGGMMYIKPDDAAAATLELPAGAWLRMDLNGTAKQAGMDPGALTGAAPDPKALVLSMLKSSSADDSAAAYENLTKLAGDAANVFADSAFTLIDGKQVVNGYRTLKSGASYTFKLSLAQNSRGEVTGYEFTVSGASDMNLPADIRQKLSTLGGDADRLNFELSAGMSDSKGMTAAISANLGTLFTMNTGLSATYAPTAKTPETAPPAGSVVVDFTAAARALQNKDAAKSIQVSVIGKDGQAVSYPLRTDAENLGQALLENGVVSGSIGQYGLYITAAGGYTADESAQEWWSITKSGAFLETGADSTPISDGDQFELTLKTGW